MWDCTVCGKKNNTARFCDGDVCFEEAPKEWSDEQGFANWIANSSTPLVVKAANREQSDLDFELELLQLELLNWTEVEVDPTVNSSEKEPVESNDQSEEPVESDDEPEEPETAAAKLEAALGRFKDDCASCRDEAAKANTEKLLEEFNGRLEQLAGADSEPDTVLQNANLADKYGQGSLHGFITLSSALGKFNGRPVDAEWDKKEAADAVADASTRLIDSIEDMDDEELKRQFASPTAELTRENLIKEAETLKQNALAVSTREEEAAKVTQQVEEACAQLLEAHNRSLVEEIRAELVRCQSEAEKANVTLDRGAVDTAKQAMEDCGKLTYIIEPYYFQESLAALAEVLAEAKHYGEQADTTKDRKLKIADEALGHHAELLPGGPDQVRDLLGRIEPGRLTDLGPGPMGIASPHYDLSGNPKVEVVAADGGFRLAKTEAKEIAQHTCTIMPIGEFTLGKIGLVELGHVTVQPATGKKSFGYKLESAKNSWAGKLLKRGVTDETYREIEMRELEHLVDFSYAFQIGPVALAAVVNRIAENQYDTEAGPINALVADLSKSGLAALIPADPYKPADWTKRMGAVLCELAGESKLRDTRGTHSPKGNDAVEDGDAVVIHPVFGTESLETTKIINLDKVTVVFGGAATEDGTSTTLTVGDEVKVAKDAANLELFTAVDGKDPLTEKVKAGTTVRIETEPEPLTGLVWVSTPFSGFDDRAYFRIHVAKLS